MEPAYLETYRRGRLAGRIEQALDRLACCRLCPRRCAVNRLDGETGLCRTARAARVASWGPHSGEEAVLVGRYGSGTVFFSGCNLLCVFCQNHDISHTATGEELTADQLARIMVDLQDRGVHNINFVSPSHVVPQILEALPPAIERGLSIPLVYNTGGYDCIETLQLLDGIVDIYMPDIKFAGDIPATFYCKAPDYPAVVKQAVKEMHRQVGDLTLSAQNRAVRGLLVRHLVMPDGLAGTPEVMQFLSRQISPDTYVNIMDQYHPCGKLERFPELMRRITPEEYQEALAAAGAAGLTRLDSRERSFIHFWR